MTCAHVAITCHLFAASHFRIGHLWVRQTSECRSRQPNGKKDQDDAGTPRGHNKMLSVRCLRRKRLRNLATSTADEVEE
jgi:hypothetical protein